MTRWAISLDKLLAKEIKRSAAGQSISGWIADAARRKLRSARVLALVAEYEAEHGEITEAQLETVGREIAAARRGRKPRKRARR